MSRRSWATFSESSNSRGSRRGRFFRSHPEANASASGTEGLAAKASGLNRLAGGNPERKNPELRTLRGLKFVRRQNPFADGHLRVLRQVGSTTHQKGVSWHPFALGSADCFGFCDYA